jgi:hypothetical protein
LSKKKGKAQVFLVTYKAVFVGNDTWHGTVSVSGTDEESPKSIEKKARNQIHSILRNRFKLTVDEMPKGTYFKTSDRITAELENGTYVPPESED